MPTEPNPDFPVVARFEVRRRRYINEDGTLVRPLPESLAAPRSVVRLYRAMVLARTLDAKCVALNRQGRLGTYATAYGQEAVPVGVASAMRRSDVLVPSYRENAALLWRGVGIHEVLSYYAGSERGSDWAGPAHDFPTSTTVGGHALHAAGAAFAVQYRGEARAVACVFGDAATSKGDVYEAPYTGGFGAEIAARTAERALDSLRAPIERVTGFDTVMPLPKLERDYLPGVERIVAALRRTLASD